MSSRGHQRVHRGSSPSAPASDCRCDRNAGGASRVAPGAAGSAASTKTTGAAAAALTAGAR